MTVVEREVVVTERERRARVLEAAALEIEVRGWCRGQDEDESGRVCAVGAVAIAMNLPLFTYRTDKAVDDLMGFFPMGFNDARGRTADEVTFLLRWRAEEIRDGR